jgi:hypothetical protein
MLYWDFGCFDLLFLAKLEWGQHANGCFDLLLKDFEVLGLNVLKFYHVNIEFLDDYIDDL